MKVALRDVGRGEVVFRYGCAIGVATADIPAGDLVHVHNLDAREFVSSPTSFLPPVESTAPAESRASTARGASSPCEARTFLGFRRPDGRVGTRNYIAIVSTVNCSAFVAKEAARRASTRLLPSFPNVDGVFAVTHSRGCGLATGSAAHDRMDRAIAGYLDHPNVGARVVVGLGCEKGQASRIVEPLTQLRPAAAEGASPNGEASSSTLEARPLTITMQEEGGTERSIERLVDAVAELLPAANSFAREPVPASHLTLGTQCGGSDGLSGITANPAIGRVSDRIVEQGGRSVFAETTETFGAAHLIVSRARSRDVALRYLQHLEEYGDYLERCGASFHSNTAAGNFAGGISTLPEKALGSVLKSGTAPLEAVYDYAERIDTPGLGFMNTPAYDPASCTALGAGGVTIGLFSTGRGSCYGSKPVPWIKVASNTPLFERMSRDMDANAGRIVDGDESLDEFAGELFELALAVASGERVWSERHGYGDDEFVLWDTGPMT